VFMVTVVSRSNLGNNILLMIFFAFSVFWLYIVSSFRVLDVTFDDSLSLLSKMPLSYIAALFLLVSLSLVCFYFRKNRWSVAFAGLFTLYFWITPWFIEPLRVIDTYFHFSRVLVVMSSGNIPTFEAFYFQYPGSTIWGTAFLSLTGLDSLSFLKYVFPIASTAIFSLGFCLLAKTIYGDIRVVGPSLLLVSLFGYGGWHFSPIGFGWMILPILLYLILQRGKNPSLCFILLSSALVISHPTTSVFLLGVFPVALLTSRLWKGRPQALDHMLLSRSLIFVAILCTWNSFIASNVFMQSVAGFISQVLRTLFNPQNISTGILQPVFSLVEVSIARRLFVVLAGVFAVVVLLKGIQLLVGGKNPSLSQIQKIWAPILISVVSVGLLLFPLFLISTPVFGLYYFFAFALFGASLSLGMFKFDSLKRFVLLMFLVLLLLIPSFIEAYPVEQYNILRDPIRYGMIFTGSHIDNPRATVVSPRPSQLYSFMNFDSWQNIEDPLFVGAKFSSQILSADYFVFRIDGAYEASLTKERALPNETQYWKDSMSLLSNTTFASVYSSGEYILFVREIQIHR
jgi:hypothetical protein